MSKSLEVKSDYISRWGKVIDESKLHGYNVVHGYEDYYVMAGQGTIALEVMKDLPDMDTIIVPIGGGGLISGIAAAIKETSPDIRVIGVQAEECCPFYKSREAKRRVSLDKVETIADGLACNETGENTFPIIEKYVDEIVTVKEKTIMDAMRLIADRCKLLAEPASSVGVAAFLDRKIQIKPDEKVCAVVTSGNWGLKNFGRLFDNKPVSGIHI